MHTRESLWAQLRAMNAPQDRIVLMHTSLRSIGAVEGGGEALLQTLIDYFTANGGLFCIPTHTWDNLYKDVITLDMQNPDSNLGAFTVLAARHPDGVRSENPTHSMVVFGERARALDFIKDDAFVKTPTAPESCYGKLFDEGGFVLLVGVSQSKNTYLHTVAEMLHIPDRMDDKPISVTVRRLNGEIVPRELTLFACSSSEDISERFPKYETAFRYHGAITDGLLGHAPAQLCDAVRMKEVVELILSRSGGKDPLGSEHPIPPSWYCTKQ